MNLPTYDGPVHTGLTFVYQPLVPTATVHVQVIDVATDMGLDEDIVLMTSWVKHSKANGAYEGELTWVPLDHFRESVMRTEHSIQPCIPKGGSNYEGGYPFDTGMW